MSIAQHILLYAVMLSPCVTEAQVQMDKPLEFTGGMAEDRQLQGLAEPEGPNDVLSAGAAQSGILRTATAVTGTLWNVDLPALGTAPAVGTHLIVRSPEPVVGTITLSLNGVSPYPVMRGMEPLEGTAFAAGSMVSLVFTGEAFQVLNGRAELRRDCPSGMAQVNAQFCIEQEERAASDFFEAASACNDAGRRLCTWGEWYAACTQATGIGLVDMTNNYEWTNSTSNEDNSARIVGQNNCGNAGNSLSSGSTNRGSRCCFTR